MTINGGASLDALSWFSAFISVLIVVFAAVGFWADRRWADRGERRK